MDNLNRDMIIYIDGNDATVFCVSLVLFGPFLFALASKCNFPFVSTVIQDCEGWKQYSDWPGVSAWG